MTTQQKAPQQEFFEKILSQHNRTGASGQA